MKVALRASFGGLKQNARQLETALFEVEAAVNRRPLTYVSDDTEDAEPLTPAHFVFGLPPPKFLDGQAVGDTTIRRRLLLRQKFAETFWRRWLKEYLSSLMFWRRHLGSGRYEPQRGDTVLVREASPRHTWPMGRVEDTIEGRDGVTRAVVIRLRGRPTRRLVSQLVPLERVE